MDSTCATSARERDPQASVDNGRQEDATNDKRAELARLRAENRRSLLSRCGHHEASHDIRRSDDPVTMDPPIEATEQARHSIAMYCELFEVSHAALLPTPQ